jgi:hypothetical protein
MKNPLKSAIAVIDKKMARFDPLVQAEKGTGGLRSRYNDKTGIARYREVAALKTRCFTIIPAEELGIWAPWSRKRRRAL